MHVFEAHLTELVPLGSWESRSSDYLNIQIFSYLNI